ncbi:mCG146043, partial [Mus musculus]
PGMVIKTQASQPTHHAGAAIVDLAANEAIPGLGAGHMAYNKYRKQYCTQRLRELQKLPVLSLNYLHCLILVSIVTIFRAEETT